MNFRILIVLFFLFSAASVFAQSLSELEQQKIQAVEEGNFKLAAELKQKIAVLREQEAAEKIRKAEEAKKGAESGLQASKEIEILEQQKKEAVANQDFILANQLLTKIKDLKSQQAASKSSATTTSNTQKSGNENAIEFLEKEKAEAVADANYKLAAEINAKIKELKAAGSGSVTAIANNSDATAKIKELESQKAKAVADANYKLAGEINAQIKYLKENPAQALAANNLLAEQIKKLEDDKAKAVAAADYKLAGELSNRIKELKANPSQSIAVNAQLAAQIKELEDAKAKAVAAADYRLANELNNKIKTLKNPPASGTSAFAISTPFQSTSSGVVMDNTGVKISRSGENEMAGIKYRRSSLYTIMRNDASAPYASVIEGAFINSPLPEKFNNHNLGTRVIRPSDQVTNEVAKQIVAAWFNRDDQGRFNMELVEQRGLYNATNLDLNIAQGSSRGMAILADAGEELIGNTFVVINEFKYTSKEEVADKTSKGLRTVGFLASFIPGAGGTIASTVSNVAAVGVTVAGKGYWVKNTSHLYQLVWNQQIANEFYTRYWMDANSYDINKKQAFESSNMFTLRYIGFESAGADLQSSIFTNKSEEELIAKATVKAVDAGISKLQRKFEQFRTKTPLHSVDPLTAKIGLKEGLEAGDKFEVLEQVQDANGKIQYVRKGIIYVDGNNIWDNRYTIEELAAMGKSAPQNQVTFFRGGTGYAPGMLIRQIN
jgi:hypothetical protein